MQKHFNKKKIEESLKKFQTDQRKFWHWSLKGYDPKHNVTVQFNFLQLKMTNFCVWSRSRSRPFLCGDGAGAGADPIGNWVAA